jgi:hypothetical protein
MRRPTCLVVLLLLAIPGLAAAAKVTFRKPAWQWTLDERLAARFDPAAQARREAAHRDVVAHLHLNGPADVVEGKEAPELYLPTELFSHLLRVAFPPPGAGATLPRRAIEERAASLGFTGDLWPRLEIAVAPHLDLQLGSSRLFGPAPALGGKGLFGKEATQRAQCRHQADALAAAKAEFGEEQFLRLLYEVVAPTVRLSYSVNWMSRAEARYIEQGCPAPA